MSRLRRLLGVFGLLAISSSVSYSVGFPSALAAVPQVKAQVTATEVSLGETFVLQVTALVDTSDEVPSSPRLTPPAGMLIRSGPGISTQTQVSINNGRMSQKVGVACTWRIEATKTGRFRIGPASFLWGGKRIESSVVEVNVLPANAHPARPKSGMPMDPFDLLGIPGISGIPNLLGGDDPSANPAEPTTDPSLAMDVAPDRAVFLRAMVSKNQAIVGEQLTLSIYQYVKTGLADPADLHEPNAPDFLQVPLLSPGEEPEPRYANVAGSVWRARLLRKIALFPLKTGQLEIGPMKAIFVGIGLRNAAPRQSPPVLINVTDAPSKGRPLGFRSGDVGSFTLWANVEPRSIDQGGAVAVTVKLKGIGNLPMSLSVPSKTDVEWLEPQTNHRPEIDKDRIGGLRTFTYVVKPSKAGEIDLGDITLPFYDPERRTYDTAKASLGKIKVAPNTAAAPVSSAPNDPFSAIGGPKETANPAASLGTKPITDTPWYWLALFFPPVGIVAAGAAYDSTRKLREGLQRWKVSSQRQADLAIREAKDFDRSGKKKECLAALERALHASIEAATGLRSRGILRDRLTQELMDRGISSGLAEKVVQIFADSEALRFEPVAESSRASDLILRAEQVISDLPVKARRKSA